MTELGGKPYRLPLQLYIIYWGRQNEKSPTFTTLLPLKEALQPRHDRCGKAVRRQHQCGKGEDQKPARQRRAAPRGLRLGDGDKLGGRPRKGKVWLGVDKSRGEGRRSKSPHASVRCSYAGLAPRGNQNPNDHPQCKAKRYGRAQTSPAAVVQPIQLGYNFESWLNSQTEKSKHQSEFRLSPKLRDKFSHDQTNLVHNRRKNIP